MASLVVDPDAGATNVLYVSSINDPEMSRLMKQVAQRVSDPMDRPLRDPRRGASRHAEVARSTVYLLSGLWIVLGFLVALAWAVLGRVRRRPGPVGAGSVLRLVASAPRSACWSRGSPP